MKKTIATPPWYMDHRQNIKEISIYFAVRHCIEPTWLNDRDQFLYPNDGWQVDEEFQSDCLTYTLFNNNIQSQYGVNHWIPFTEQEVDAKEKFESHFMSNYIAGKWPTQTTVQGRLWDKDTQPQPILFHPNHKLYSMPDGNYGVTTTPSPVPIPMPRSTISASTFKEQMTRAK